MNRDKCWSKAQERGLGSEYERAFCTEESGFTEDKELTDTEFALLFTKFVCDFF